MKKFVILITLCTALTGCGDFIQDLVFPPDETLELPNGNRIRLFCVPNCPSHAKTREALSVLRTQWKPHVTFEPYDAWSNYAITFSNSEMWRGDRQIMGATFHGRQGVYIWMPRECKPYPKGLCPGVFDWEMGLVLAEHNSPFSPELEKLRWREERGLTNELTSWEIE